MGLLDTWQRELIRSIVVFAGINCLLVLYVIFLIPETKGVPLEEMDRLFGGTSHVQGGKAILQEEQTRGHDDKPDVGHANHRVDVLITPEDEKS